MSFYGINGGGDGSDGDRGSSRGRGRGNWHQKPEELRKPHLSANEIVKGTQNKGIVENSTLSPNAQEFVPRNFAPNQSSNSHQNHSVQNRLSAARQSGQNSQANNMYQPQMMQHNYCQDNQYHRYDQMVNYNHQYPTDHNSINQRKNNEPSTDLNITINQLESSIRVLTVNPGEFDCLVPHLVDLINPFFANPSQLKEIVNIIIKQSIYEGNFRYSGARLCTHLDTVSNPSGHATSVFTDILIQKCEEERDAHTAVWQRSQKHTDDEEKKCHGLILFLAELVTQLQSSSSTLGKMLIQLISSVLHNPAPSSAKTICQALKLAGQTLEQDNGSSGKDMETVMRQLSDLVISGGDTQISRMVESVAELRKNSWGRASTITSAHRPEVTSQQNIGTPSFQNLNEPVFYGPDGEVISAEESAFLHGFATEKDEDFINEAYNDGDLTVDPEEEEDDMIAAAYEEFLKLSENKNEQIKN